MKDRELIEALDRTTAALTALMMATRFHEHEEAEQSEWWHRHGLGNRTLAQVIDEANRSIGAARVIKRKVIVLT